MGGLERKHFVVIVLGDVGRSPRMQYHAVSLLEEGHLVSLVGYEGVDLIPALSASPDRLNLVRFSVPSPTFLRKIPPIYLLWRIVSLCTYLYHAIKILIPKGMPSAPVDCFLVQNPPAIPLLAVVYLYCYFCRVFCGHQPAMVVDWHNLGFSMLSQPIFSKLARLYEGTMAPLATAHLCVTKAMKRFLTTEFGIPENRISILYDCPPELFQPLPCKDQHALLTRLHDQLCEACPREWYSSLDTDCQTLFTEKKGASYTPRQGRPALVTSSTSWTPDEDFGIFLDAVITLDEELVRTASELRVLFVVTGRGPQKDLYMERISKMNLQNVGVQTLWLEPIDYPRLLACADLGVSLHTSTSGIDLPMKVLDLFGCGVPVCAMNFQCLPELVEDGMNGRSFATSAELYEQLKALLYPLHDRTKRYAPHSFGDLENYSKALEGRRRWSKNWTENAKATLLQAIQKAKDL